MATFTDRLLQLKNQRGVLQKDIACAAKISLRTYQRYESGERKPDTDVLTSIADYFEVSTDYLLGRTEDPTRR